MTKLPIYLFLAVIMLCAFSCVKHNDSHAIIDNISRAEKTLADSMPDSTLAILHTINIDSISDSRLKAKVLYIKGTAKRLMLDYPTAMRTLLYAEREAAESKEYHLLGNIRRQITLLNDSISNTSACMRYTLSAADAYEACMEYDSAFNVLNNGLDYCNDIDTKKLAYQRMIDLTYLTNDSNITFFRPALTIYSRDSSLTFNFNLTNRYYGISKRLMDSINSNGNWEALIKCDTLRIGPVTVRHIASDLYEAGRDSEANALLECYCKYYTCTELGNTNNAVLHLTQHFNTPFTLSGIILSRQGFFSSYIPSIERIINDFYYEEIVIKEQTIRHQREMLIAITLICILILCITVLIFRIVNTRRRKREELMIQSATELKSALNSTHDKWLTTLAKLCDTYYDAYVKQSSKTKVAKTALAEINQAIDTEGFFDKLEHKLNSEQDGLSHMFRSEMPALREDEHRLFMLNALGFSVPTLALLMRENRDLIYTRRVRLRSKVQESTPPHAELFLHALE